MDLIKDVSASKKRGAQNWAYKRTLNGADYNTDAVRKISITEEGSGYLVAPAVTIAAPAGAGGVTATAVAIIAEGKVTAINITNEGSGYLTKPAVTLAAPPAGGTQATADSQLIDIWHVGSLRKASEISFDQAEEIDELEDGMPTYPEPGKITASVSLTLGQDDVNTIKFLMRESKKYEFSLMYEKGKSTNSSTQQIFVPYTRLNRSYSAKSGDRKPVTKFNIMNNLAAVVPSNVPDFCVGVAADYTCPAEEYFEPFEK
jgi:hypothetical protein